MTTAPETSLNGLSTVPTSGSRPTAVGKTIHVGRRAATAEGEVRDEEWRLVAHGATTCLIHRWAAIDLGLDTLRLEQDGRVLTAYYSNPPSNYVKGALLRDLDLLTRAVEDDKRWARSSSPATSPGTS